MGQGLYDERLRVQMMRVRTFYDEHGESLADKIRKRQDAAVARAVKALKAKQGRAGKSGRSTLSRKERDRILKENGATDDEREQLRLHAEELQCVDRMTEQVVTLACAGVQWAIEHCAQRNSGRVDTSISLAGKVHYEHEHSYVYQTYEEARDRLLQDGIDIERMPQLADLRAEQEAVLAKIARENDPFDGGDVIEGEAVEASGGADAPEKEPETKPGPDGPKKPPNKPDALPQAPPKPSRFG